MRRVSGRATVFPMRWADFACVALVLVACGTATTHDASSQESTDAQSESTADATAVGMEAGTLSAADGMEATTLTASQSPCFFEAPSESLTAADASCAGAFVVLEGPLNQCVLTTADVVCATDADCTWFLAPSCNGGKAYGENKQAMVHAPPAPPCVPPKEAVPPPAWLMEDCQVVSSVSAIGVKCVNQACMTFATPGS